LASVRVTVKVPLVLTVILCVVAPLLHRLPVAELDVSCTLPPWQKVVGPLGVIVGADGNGFTVTCTDADAAEVQLFASVRVTVKVPLVLTVILCVIAPLLHRLPVAELDVSCTLPPWQKVVGPLGVIVGADGNGFTVT
jgi:hypothetical protein